MLATMARTPDGGLRASWVAQLAPAYGAPAGGGGGIQVDITNNSGGEVKTRKRQSGGKSVIDVVFGAVGDKMASGSFDAPMQAR